ncbi:hypothetical protein [Xanthomonas oryzae]|uniref:hypothetical protein n=1 Tax=Xanthomonas oryzae TaxID=347 RepID=UPI001404B94D|nr:hypothetical protein [Xanthomonas oryzae]UNE64862.1 hypothetical protein MML47_19825 [Xanthomonas oryzae]
MALQRARIESADLYRNLAELAESPHAARLGENFGAALGIFARHASLQAGIRHQVVIALGARTTVFASSRVCAIICAWRRLTTGLSRRRH